MKAGHPTAPFRDGHSTTLSEADAGRAAAGGTGVAGCQAPSGLKDGY